MINSKLTSNAARFTPTEEELNTYKSLLNADSTGMMGYIEIPEIRCELAIYHTVDESVLQVGIGHLEGSSLPVGGSGTHCVLSGHRGLPSAQLTFAASDVTLTSLPARFSILCPRTNKRCVLIP